MSGRFRPHLSSRGLAMVDELPPAPRPWLRPRLAIAGGLALLTLLAAAVWSWGESTPQPKLPDPNGFDNLVAAGSCIRGDWPSGTKGLEDANRVAMKAFVEANRPVLDLARVGLSRDCLVHFEDSQAGLEEQIEGQRRFKDVWRLLTIEGLVAESEGRIGDAGRSYRDILFMGQALTQDGMLTDAKLGWFLQKLAGNRLRRILGQLSKEDLKATILDLEAIDRRRVSAGAVVARWRRWYRGAFSTIQQSLMRWNGLEATERANQRTRAAQGARPGRAGSPLSHDATGDSRLPPRPWDLAPLPPGSGPGLPCCRPDRLEHREADRLPGQPLRRIDRRPEPDRPDG